MKSFYWIVKINKEICADFRVRDFYGAVWEDNELIADDNKTCGPIDFLCFQEVQVIKI